MIELRELTPADWRMWRNLRLDVAEGNEKAAALYRRNGFAQTGELPGPLPDGAHMERVMVKHLGTGASTG